MQGADITKIQDKLRASRAALLAEVEELDMHLEDGKVMAYRAKIKLSFKYEGKEA